MMQQNLVEIIRKSITDNWDKKALTNYGGISITYSGMAEKMLYIHTIFDYYKIAPGDKVALVGKNSLEWAYVYLATISFGAVIVPILPDFKPGDIHHIINHSDSKLVFLAENIFETLEPEQTPLAQAYLSIGTLKPLSDSGKDNQQSVNPQGFPESLPQSLTRDSFTLPRIENKELAVISYTSGTTGFTKGVMLSHNNLVANVVYANENMPLQAGDEIVSFLPLAHSYGCLFEFLWPFTLGCHVTILTKTPSPQIILKAFREVRPRLVLAVPLIMEKIYKKQILPVVQKKTMKLLLNTPLVSKILESKIRQKLIDSFGGNFHEVVIGGAPLSAEVEDFLHRINFPFSIGYGMTECAPLISYANWDKTRLRSAGKVVDSLQIKIEKHQPADDVGEILVKGENVMLGYYKNPQATTATIETDGWMHTGDLGMIDNEGFVFIKGRSKSMILGSSGQNIYPEEIEARFNNMEYIQESLVVENNGKLIALIYPDFELADKNGVDEKALLGIFESHRKALNNIMPAYMGISGVKIFQHEFEKTPKKSIKRYLYNN